MNETNTILSENEKIRLIVRDETNILLLNHLRLCPLIGNKIEERIRTLETKLAKLIGFMIGSGLLGGASGAIVAKFLN